MTVEKINANTNITIIDNLNIGDGFIKSTMYDTERFYIIVGHNIGEGFYRALDLENGTESIFYDYEIVRKIDKITV